MSFNYFLIGVDGTYYSLGAEGEEGHEVDHIKCELYKYNPIRKLFEQVWEKGSQYAKRVAVAEDGSPWTVRSSCQDIHIYKPK